MKKIPFLFLLLLMACSAAVMEKTSSPITPPIPTRSQTIKRILSPTPSQPVIIFPTSVPTTSNDEHLRKLFGIDDQCICWLGINPGITSVKATRAILSKSEDIHVFRITDNRIELTWIDDVYVVIYLEKDLVKSVYFKNMRQRFFYVMTDFIKVFGSPDEISIGIYQSPHCDDVLYSVYYPSRKMTLSIVYGAWDGPNPADIVDELSVGIEFDEYLQLRYIKSSDPRLHIRQPWLGYGHIKDYLPKPPRPTGPCNP